MMIGMGRDLVSITRGCRTREGVKGILLTDSEALITA